MNNSLTVIIPCYNDWQWMTNCLCSLENQTLTPDEVIIWDDCSTDDSYKQLVTYSQKSNLNIVVHHNDVNCGPSVSRERAIRVATSNYIAFCDADDWYESMFIKEIKNALDTQYSDFIMFNNFRVRDNKKILCDVTSVLNKANNRQEQIALAPMSLCRIVVRKDLLEHIKFNNLYYGEDSLILCQLIARAQSPFFINDAYYNYYMREGSAHSKPNKRCFEDSVKGYKLIKEYMGAEYPDECTYIAIKNFVYSGTILGFKAGVQNNVIENALKDFKATNPEYIKNKYMRNMNLIKKFYVKCAYYQILPICRILTVFHNLLMGH